MSDVDADDGAALWPLFLDDARAHHAAAASLLDAPTVAFGSGGTSRLAVAAGELYALRTSAQLLGVDALARVAAAVERALDAVAGGAAGWDVARAPILGGLGAIAAALDELAQADASGARIVAAPIEAAVAALDAATAGITDGPGGDEGRAGAPGERGPAPAPATRGAPAPSTDDLPTTADADDEARWVPQVDEDMIDPFLEEAQERLAALADKLLRLERSPNDAELVRDLFRDLHTVKGSSGFVGLRKMNRLAHAAEDLIGQVRDGTRVVDRALVDALLGAADALRAILDRAVARAPIDVDLAPHLARLRGVPSHGGAPASPPPGPLALDPDGDDAAPVPADAPPGARPAEPHSARQTLRVDFDKLDLLLNLVGELVLGKATLHAGVAGVAALGRELDAMLRRARRQVRAADPAPAIARARAGSATTTTALVRVGAGAHSASNAPASVIALVPDGAAPSPHLDELDRAGRVFADLSRDLAAAAARLDHVSAELRDQVMKLRMLPIARVFNKYHRTVRELSHALGRRVRLEVYGAETELDKVLVEQLDEPLLHLVRNAVDHGCEPPERRIAAGKPAEATVTLAAWHQGSQILVEVSDDGAGIDPARLRDKALEKGLATAAELAALDDRAVLDVIFRPGFSTAARVSEVSGRGVGMDVVREAITRLKGSIDIASTPGAGTAFTLKLPLTLAIIQVLIVRAAGYDLAIPLDAVRRTLSLDAAALGHVHGRPMVMLDDAEVPLLALDRALDLDAAGSGLGAGELGEEVPVVLVDALGDTFALACDRLVGKQEIVIKTLGELLDNVPCVAGATLLGDRVALILDVPAVVARGVKVYADRAGAGRTGGVGGTGARPPSDDGAARAIAADDAGAATARRRPRLLVAEDSDVIRESLRRLFESHGYEVTAARDGAEALAIAESDPRGFDAVSTDVMMPHLDGYELTRALRRSVRHRAVPIVMVTARGEQIDRVRGFDAGVDEYIVKPLDHAEILRAIARHLPGAPTGAARSR